MARKQLNTEEPLGDIPSTLRGKKATNLGKSKSVYAIH